MIKRHLSPSGTPSPIELGESKLHESGLTLEDAGVLGISFLTGPETKALCPKSKNFYPLMSLRLDYFDHNGHPLSDVPGAPPFYRLRYLEEKAKDFDSIADNSRFPKYVQEPHTIPCAYFPKNVDWSSIIEDVNQPVIFTEGELKSAKACKEGFPTVGLGGVHNWRSYKLGIEWLPSLAALKLVRRNVYICFDSDYKSNEQVCRALKSFGDELQNRGALVHLVTLPQLAADSKTGLDDFLVQSGPDANDQFAALLSEATPLGLCAPLWQMNAHYCYVQDPGLIIDRRTNAKVNPGAFTGHLQAPQVYQERELKKDGTISYKATSAAAKWLKWPLRTEVNRLTYRPGQEDMITDRGLPAYNIWSGWGVEPKKGNAKPFTALVDHVFMGAEAGVKDWFLDWCAYPLQHPGVKLFSSVVIHGIVHGTGKSLLGYTLSKIYGKNFSEISQMDLHNSFNEWAEAKQFVMGDDVTGSNKRADADFLKKLITQQELRVNPKYVASYVVPDCINYFFTSNSPDSFFLEDHDRRFFIHEVLVGPKSEEFYSRYSAWLYKEGGAAIVFDYLLNRDLSKFNPAAPAMKTEAKERMINTVQSDLGSWCRLLRATPDGVLVMDGKPLKRDLFSSKELCEWFYDPDRKTGTTAGGLGRELLRSGFRQVWHGRPLRMSNGLQGRYFVVRNVEKWIEEEDVEKLVEHIENADVVPDKKKKY